MSKPPINPGPLAPLPAIRPGMRSSCSLKRPEDEAKRSDDAIALLLISVAQKFDEALKTNATRDWSNVDEMVGELKHLTHLKFLDARQAAAAAGK